MELVAREWRRMVNRCVWSWQGIRESWVNEHSFRSWVWVNLISVCLCFIFDLTGTERALLITIGLMILAIELVNSAIERAIDYISEDRHPLAKAAKDAGSSAVAVTAIAGALAWILILWG